jgi:hypothetical protein
MGNTEAAGNIERLNARMVTNEAYRQESITAIADIENARAQAKRAGDIAA